MFDLTLNTAGDFFEASAKLCTSQPLKRAPLPVLLFLKEPREVDRLRALRVNTSV